MNLPSERKKKDVSDRMSIATNIAKDTINRFQFGVDGSSLNTAMAILAIKIFDELAKPE